MTKSLKNAERDGNMETKPVMLMILDGFGINDKKDTTSQTLPSIRTPVIHTSAIFRPHLNPFPTPRHPFAP